MPNQSFTIPRRTQKITSVTATTVVQYNELVGNLPQRKKYADRVPREGAREVFGQAFTSTKERIKAIGLYLKSDFRPAGERRSGSVILRLYSWGTYGDFTTLTQMTLPLSGKPAEVEVNIENIQNLNETMFEFEEFITLTIGDNYFFTITQLEGYSDKKPIYIGTSGDNYGNVLGDFWVWDTIVPIQSKRQTPSTDFVFQAYISILELSVDIVGPGSGNLTGIQEALEIDETLPANPLISPQSLYGIIDFTKPFKSHGQALIDPTTVYGDAPVKVNGTPMVVPFGHGGFSAVADLLIDMDTMAVPISFTDAGSGQNDLSVEDYSTVKDLIVIVTIKTAGTPDTFDWRAVDIGGVTIATGTDIPITGLNQNLQALTPSGLTTILTVKFGATTGHFAGDRWDFYVANWDFAIIRVATDRIRMDWGDAGDTLDCSNTGSFRLLEEADAIIVPEYVSKFAFRKHLAGDSDPTISITLWRTDRP